MSPMGGVSGTDPTAQTLRAPAKCLGAAPTYTRVEAAKLLRVSVDWLREHHSELPHLRMGRKILFTDAHLAEIQRAREVRPGPQPVTDGIRRRRRMPVDWRTLP